MAMATTYTDFLERKLHTGAGRRGVGIELKPSYYRQAVRNLELSGSVESNAEQAELFAA